MEAVPSDSDVPLCSDGVGLGEQSLGTMDRPGGWGQRRGQRDSQGTLDGSAHSKGSQAGGT